MEARLMDVSFLELGSVDMEELQYAVIVAQYEGQWVLVRHKERDTWEVPGGRREAGEDIAAAARRELIEETGAQEFSICPMCIYSVNRNGTLSYGQLFFATVSTMGDLPQSEIAERAFTDKLPDKLTYPLIQPKLFEYCLARGRMSNV